MGLCDREKEDTRGVSASALGRARNPAEDVVAPFADLFGRETHGPRSVCSEASAPRLASRSALVFSSRRTCPIAKRRNRLARVTASESSGFKCPALIRKR